MVGAWPEFRNGTQRSSQSPRWRLENTVQLLGALCQLDVQRTGTCLQLMASCPDRSRSATIWSRLAVRLAVRLATIYFAFAAIRLAYGNVLLAYGNVLLACGNRLVQAGDLLLTVCYRLFQAGDLAYERPHSAKRSSRGQRFAGITSDEFLEVCFLPSQVSRSASETARSKLPQSA